MTAISKLFPRLALVMLLGVSTTAWSANIIVINGDPPGTGFNDPTLVTPVGGNPAETLGLQRQFVFSVAASVWGEQLQSDVDIYLLAFFSPLSCGPTSGVLGAAGPTQIFANFPGAPVDNVWHYGALADSLAGFDLDVTAFDMVAQFNGDIGVNPDCLTGQSWYNGFDHHNDPNSEIDLLSVVMHEFAHGLGFLEIVSEADGSLLGGLPDVYMLNMLDASTGKTWPEMTNEERLESQVNTGNLVWAGEQVTHDAPDLLGPRTSVFALAPRNIFGSVEAQPASFGPPIGMRHGAFGRLVVAEDGTDVSTDGCEPITNRVRWRIALIDRGGCGFTQKVANAQAAGAQGVIIVNNVPKGLPPMGGSDPSIHIQSVGVSMDDGARFKKAAARFAFGSFILDQRYLAGANLDGYVRLYAPDPVSPGSSKSHFDTTADPNLLMEPFISDDLVPSIYLDLTTPLLQDIGWVLQ